MIGPAFSLIFSMSINNPPYYGNHLLNLFLTVLNFECYLFQILTSIRSKILRNLYAQQKR